MALLACFAFTACVTGDETAYKNGFIEVQTVRKGNQAVDRITIAGNTYTSPAIVNRPHLLQLHHHRSYLYIEDQGQDNELLVYACDSPRRGITREIPLNHHELSSLLKSMDDPVAEYISGENDESSLPLWTRIELHDAAQERPMDATSPQKLKRYLVDVLFEKKKILISEANTPKPLSPEQYRPEDMQAYKAKTFELSQWDIFEGNGNASYLARNKLYWKSVINFGLWRTEGEFEHGPIRTSNIRNRFDDGYGSANVEIAGHIGKDPAYWDTPYVIKVHAGGNSNMYLYPDRSAPNITLIDIANNRTEHVNFQDKGDLKIFVEQLCRMRSPLLVSHTTFHPGETLNKEVAITWAGKSIDVIASEKGIQKFRLKIDLQFKTVKLEAIK